MSPRHVALIVEDDPQIAEILKELVTSLDHDWRHASTLEEARAAVAAGGFCYVLLDMQIPADATSRASVGCGETVLRLIRRAHPARSARDAHVVPVLVVTSYSRDPDFVSKMHKEGADDFLAKPFGERIDRVLDAIRDALERAGRAEHSACGAASSEHRGPAPVAAAPAKATDADAAPTVRISIDGTYLAQRNEILVNDVPATLPDSSFIVFLSAVAAHQRARGEWESATKLGMARNRWAPTRIQSELKELVPPHFRVVEANKPHNFRLNPAITIERVAWDVLAKHPQVAVRKIAVEAARG